MTFINFHFCTFKMLPKLFTIFSSEIKITNMLNTKVEIANFIIINKDIKDSIHNLKILTYSPIAALVAFMFTVHFYLTIVNMNV